MEKIKEFIKSKNFFILILSLLACLFIIFINSNDNTNTNEEKSITNDEIELYTTSIENKIKNLLEKADGIKDVSVLVTIEKTNENVYATDFEKNNYVIIHDSQGNEKALKVYEVTTQIRGIGIVCDYGKDEEKRKMIIELVSSLFGVKSNRISVISA